MAQRCDVCGKGPVVGNQISHAHNVSARRWLPNLVSMRAVVKGRASGYASAHAACAGARSSRPSEDRPPGVPVAPGGLR